jgi:hypothetical protein
MDLKHQRVSMEAQEASSWRIPFHQGWRSVNHLDHLEQRLVAQEALEQQATGILKPATKEVALVDLSRRLTTTDQVWVASSEPVEAEAWTQLVAWRMRDQLSHQITLSMLKERLCIMEVKEVLEAASWILLFRGHQTEEAKELHTEATKVIQAHQQLEF